MKQSKVPLYILTVLTLLFYVSCTGVNDPSIPSDFFAVTAHYYENGDSHIYLVDYNNPSKFTRITSGNSNHEVPKFSPDRGSLLYGDFNIGAAHNPGVVVYSLPDASHDTLMVNDGRYPYVLVGRDIVWNPDGTMIYFYFSSHMGLPNIHIYDLRTTEYTILRQSVEFGETVIGFFEPEMMIVYTNDTVRTGEPAGYFYMDLNGEYHGRINNPHLERIVTDHVTKKAPWYMNYSRHNNLFAFTQVDSSTPGYEIALTNLDGTYYKRFTSGYMDRYPTWGPDDNIILFDRAELSDLEHPHRRIMRLNTETGEVKELVYPALLDGAEGVSTPSY